MSGSSRIIGVAEFNTLLGSEGFIPIELAQAQNGERQYSTNPACPLNTRSPFPEALFAPC
jgi:hypothetical protein